MKKENNYDFRKRMLQVHRKDVRDYTIMPGADELVLQDGFSVILPETEDVVVETAAKDFIDYLFTSMGISAILRKSDYKAEGNCVRLQYHSAIEGADSERSYRITVGDGILLEGYDNKGIAQGLYHLEDIMNLRMAPYLKTGVETIRTMFPFRGTMSGYGVDMYPDEYLCRLAHEGITCLFLWIKDVNQTLRGYLDFNELAHRASRYGLDIYVYFFAAHSVHPDDEGAEEFYDKMYGRLFQNCPGIKGLFIVGEAVKFPSKDPRVSTPRGTKSPDGIPSGKMKPGWFPCYDWPDLMRAIQKAVYKYRPDADIILSSYNWGWAPEEERVRLINDLPDNITVLPTWDMFETFEYEDGTKGTIADYSLRLEGPGTYFKSEASAAAKRGLKVYTISMTTGRTWDFGVIPYMPAPYKWIKRYTNIRDAYHNYNLRGLYEAHHYGVYPSFITELEKWSFISPELNMEEVLKKILISHFGKENLETVDKVMHLWSDAFDYVVPSGEDQYGAFRIGPSYPFWVGRDGHAPQEDYAMHKLYGDMAGTGVYNGSSIRVGAEKKSLEKMKQLILEGLELIETITNRNEELERLINMGWFMYRTIVSGIHIKEFFVAVNRYKTSAVRQEILDAIDEMERILKAERENAELTIPLVEYDSIIGWEPSMEYTTDRKRIEWKIRQVDYELGQMPKRRERAMR